jgi:hypothetical protein
MAKPPLSWVYRGIFTGGSPFSKTNSSLPRGFKAIYNGSGKWDTLMPVSSCAQLFALWFPTVHIRLLQTKSDMVSVVLLLDVSTSRCLTWRVIYHPLFGTVGARVSEEHLFWVIPGFHMILSFHVLFTFSVFCLSLRLFLCQEMCQNCGPEWSHNRTIGKAATTGHILHHQFGI